MSTHNDGGPAFPHKQSQLKLVGVDAITGIETFSVGQGDAPGMTLRDYFAAKAMQSLCQGAVLPPGYDASAELALVAFRSYEVADAMLKARSE